MNLANAYRSIGQYEEAIPIYKKILQEQPGQVLSRISFAAALMLAGREDEARAEAAEVMRLDPKFSLERYAKALPFIQPEVDRVIDALRKAGLK
jgi:tetratricopeptide (TPR) repeat protein